MKSCLKQTTGPSVKKSVRFTFYEQGYKLTMKTRSSRPNGIYEILEINTDFLDANAMLTYIEDYSVETLNN